MWPLVAWVLPSKWQTILCRTPALPAAGNVRWSWDNTTVTCVRPQQAGTAAPPALQQTSPTGVLRSASMRCEPCDAAGSPCGLANHALCCEQGCIET